MVKHLDVLNAEQWGDLYLELATDAQKKASGVTPELVRTWGEGTDWQDALFRTAITHQHQASVSGGSEKERFLISGNYLSQDGVIRGSDFYAVWDEESQLWKTDEFDLINLVYRLGGFLIRLLFYPSQFELLGFRLLLFLILSFYYLHLE